jgi:hypothetical protein
MCKLFKVSRSCYYNWIQRGCILNRVDEDFNKLIKDIFEQSRATYGTRRIKEVLKQQYGLISSRRKIQRSLSQLNLKVKMKRRFKVITTTSNHKLPISPNYVNRDFYSNTIDKIYVGDITYIPTKEGWLYLAVVIDIYSRKVVGWSMNHTLHTSIVNDALMMAIKRRVGKLGIREHVVGADSLVSAPTRTTKEQWVNFARALALDVIGLPFKLVSNTVSVINKYSNDGQENTTLGKALGLVANAGKVFGAIAVATLPGDTRQQVHSSKSNIDNPTEGMTGSQEIAYTWRKEVIHDAKESLSWAFDSFKSAMKKTLNPVNQAQVEQSILSNINTPYKKYEETKVWDNPDSTTNEQEMTAKLNFVIDNVDDPALKASLEQVEKDFNQGYSPARAAHPSAETLSSYDETQAKIGNAIDELYEKAKANMNTNLNTEDNKSDENFYSNQQQ